MTFNPDSKHGDIFDDALVPLEPYRWFGQVVLDPFWCVLVKGQGKVPFDPVAHAGLTKLVCMKITIVPCDPTHKLIEKFPLQGKPEFTQVVWPSAVALADKIKAINPPQNNDPFNPLRSISGLWASGQLVPQPGIKPGETYTTIKFLDVYPDQAACEAAWKKASEQPTDDTQSPQPAANGNGSAPAHDPNKQALIAAFPAIWAANGGDEDKFLTAIASVFKADAPEVQAFVEKNRPPF